MTKLTSVVYSYRSLLHCVFELEYYHSILDFFNSNLVELGDGCLKRRVSSSPHTVRLAAPLFGVSLGLSILICIVGNLAEAVIKGMINVLIGIATFDLRRIKDAVENLAWSSAVLFVGLCQIVKIATLGSIGLIVAPKWAYKKIIAF